MVPDHDTSAPPLAGIRVLDLTTARGELAGRVLADLGAEVIKVEPTEGARARRLPPFDERPGSEGESLYWAAVGMGKHSVVLDIERPEDREQIRRLATRVDVLLESSDPAHMATLGLGYDQLALVNPRLVYASITPFGQHGPKANWPATELTVEAAGGLVMLQGDPDRPPIPVGLPQAAFHASAQAAADCVIALNERATSGRGQHLDTSMQEGIIWTLLHSTGFPPNLGTNPPGTCTERTLRPEQIDGVLLAGLSTLECADGYLLLGLGIGRAGAIVEQVLREVAAAGELDSALAACDWSAGLPGIFQQTDAATTVAAVRAIRSYFETRTKDDVHRWATEHDLMVAPVNDAADLHRSPQLAAREFWTTVGEREHPGPFAKLSRTPLTMARPAPALGADQSLIDATPPSEDAPSPVAGPRSGEAFEGLKVADFSWIGVGPISAKALADHGATVVHVESVSRPDILRLAQPAKNGELGLDRSQFFADYNSSKLGLSLNLATPEGRDLALRLIEWADVVVESFTPGTMKKLGLDPETILAERPDLVWYSTCLLGQTGPYATFAGFGQQGSAIAGLHGITGWPDREPAGTWGAYSDMITPHFGVAALTSAILERRRTGLGQRIDISQVEAAMQFMEPLLLDYTVNGRVAGAIGLDSTTAAPHGVYATAGLERWIAIACETDAQWDALRAVAPLEAFANLDGLAARLERDEAIDDAIAAWCADHDPFELERELTAAGVPASVAQFPTDLYEDPQLADRGFFVTLDHTVMGPTPYDGLITHFSAKQEMLHKAAPALGEDTVEVLAKLLGVSADEIESAAIAGALS